MGKNDNFMRLTVFNNGDGERYVHTKEGRKAIPSKGKIEAEFSEAEYDSMNTIMERNGQPGLTITVNEGRTSTALKGSSDGGEEQAPDFESMKKVELQDHIENRDGTRPSDAMTKAELVELAQNPVA